MLARWRPMSAPALVKVANQGRGAAEVVQHRAGCPRAAFHLAPHVPPLHDVEQKVARKLRVGFIKPRCRCLKPQVGAAKLRCGDRQLLHADLLRRMLKAALPKLVGQVRANEHLPIQNLAKPQTRT